MAKVSDDDLKTLQQMADTLNQIVNKTGELQLSKAMIERDLQEVTQLLHKEQQTFFEFRDKERVLFEQFMSKYGTSNIDIVTGEIKP